MLKWMLPPCYYLGRKSWAAVCMLIAVLCVLGFLLSFAPAAMMPNSGWNIPGKLLVWKEGWERLAWHHWEG